MMKKLMLRLSIIVVAVLVLASCSTTRLMQKKDSKLSALIVTGQNNHAWKNSTPIFKNILEDAIFSVDIAQSPEEGGDMTLFNPKFSNYDVVVLDYTGDEWNDATKANFDEYVSNGGGVVVIHAADNAFPKWEAYNKMIAIGGWGDRNEKSGPYLYYKDGKPYKDYSVGSGGHHGNQNAYVVESKKPNHPILKGMPADWRHAQDELYAKLRGPAENVEILATAYSDPETNGTGRHEPALMTIKYGKGRVFHTVLGHVGGNQSVAVQCAGFVYTLQRGTEWAATGKVKQQLPSELPGVEEPLILKKYGEFIPMK